MAAIEKTIIKARFWWFVLYPESAPEDWRDRIQLTGLPFCVSPLHEHDLNPDQTPKKAHYHVILCYNGPTTYGNVQKTITDPLNQPHPQFLNSVKGAYRYLTHQDNPDKYQYDPYQITCFNGFNTTDYCDMSITDEDRLYSAIEDFIDEFSITEFLTCVRLLKAHGQFESLSFLRRHATYFSVYIKSARHSGFARGVQIDKKDPEIDPLTGEILAEDE